MKKVIIGMTLVFMVILAISISLTIDGRSVRDNEVKKSLTSAINDSVENLMSKKHYTINNNDELIADLIQSLLVQIESTSTVKVNVLDADFEKGLLSIEVIESFKHPNGKPGTVSAVKTVIFEPNTEINSSGGSDQVKITYLLPENVVYKEFTIEKGSEVIIPQNPTMKGKTFKQWSLNGVRYNLMDAANDKIKVNENISLLAEFE